MRVSTADDIMRVNFKKKYVNMYRINMREGIYIGSNHDFLNSFSSSFSN